MRLHYGQSVLISSPTIATTIEAGSFSPTSSCVDDSAGFQEELESASSALSSQSGSPQSTAQTTTTAESSYNTYAYGGSTAGPDGGAAELVVPDQPVAQTPDRSLSSLAVRQATIDNPTTNTAAPRARGNRLPAAEDARGSRSSRDQSKTTGSACPAPATVASSTLSAAMVSPAAVPAVPGTTPVQYSKSSSSSAGSVYNVAKRISVFTTHQLDAPSGTEPTAEDPVAPAVVSSSAPDNPSQALPEALAFAVRVQPTRTTALPARASATDPVSGSPPVADTEDSSSGPHGARQTHAESDGDQGGSFAGDAAPKDAEKNKANSEVAALNPSMADGSMTSRTATDGLTASGQPAVLPRQSGSPTSDPTATIAEPPSVSPATPPQGPMKELTMRIEAAEGQKVDVRIVQRAGDLQIAVKSADDVTTQGLRHGLADLANRLNETGYHAETWRPGQQATLESSASNQSQSDQSQSDGSQSNSSGSQQDRGQRHNNPSNRPHWIDELESNLSGGTEPSGQFNGIVSQPNI